MDYNGSGAGVTLERETLNVMDDKQRIALVETRTKGNDGSPQLDFAGISNFEKADLNYDAEKLTA